MEATFPIAPSGAMFPIALLKPWLERAQRAGVKRLRLPGMPYDNGSLPSLLRLAGIEGISLPDLPRPFVWEGMGGGRVTVAQADAHPDNDELAHHVGLLPPSPWPPVDDAHELAALIDLARFEDASSAIGLGTGAIWDHILAAAEQGAHPHLPPLVRTAAPAKQFPGGAWNPLAFARRCLVTFPLENAGSARSVRDSAGARFPLQHVEGPLGTELLLELPMAGLECKQLELDDASCAGALWEVDKTVLDNGRVRAEFDDVGQIMRLCVDGQFIELAGPLPTPYVDGVPFIGPATITVLESGPVRARVSVSREHPAGYLHITYTLHAHDQVLRIAATWDAVGGATLTLDHPTNFRSNDLICAGELATHTAPQRPSVTMHSAELEHGCRWAMLGEPDGRGFALLFSKPATVAVDNGHLRLPLWSSIAYALCDVSAGAFHCGRTALALSIPGRPFTGGCDLMSPFRWAELGSLLPLWVSRPNGWLGEVLVAEQFCRKSRAFFYPRFEASDRKEEREAWKTDFAGRLLTKMPMSAEGDGFQVDAHAGEIFLLRWR
jgi:hypothetical protein